MNLAELKAKLAELKRSFDEKSVNEDVQLEELRAISKEIEDTKERIALIETNRRELEKEVVNPLLPKASEVRTLADMSQDEVDERYAGVFVRAFRGKLTNEDKAFYNELRASGAPTVQHLKTGVDADGGFLVPKQVSTMINEYKRQMEFDLQTLVDVQTTTVISGTFVYEKLADLGAMPKINQWDKIDESAVGTFETKTYQIEDYAMIIPVPRTLLQDSDQNIMAYIARVIARKSLRTRNVKILSVLKASYTTKTTVATTDDVKKVLNVTLDPAFLPNTKVITNQDGFQFLDTLKDADGKYLLQPDIKEPTMKRLGGYEVVVVPNGTLATDGKKVPVYIGDMKSAIRLFDRGVYEIATTDVGGNAFLRNSIDTRVIDRFDVQAIDTAGVVACEVTIK